MVAHQVLPEPLGLPQPGVEAATRISHHSLDRLNLSSIKEEVLAASVEEERESGVSGLESEEDGGDEQDASDPNTNGLNIQTVEFPVSTEYDTDEEGKLVMADMGEEGGEDEQEEADDLSSGTDGDESLDGRNGCNPGWRKKTKRKMEYGKKWIIRNLVFEKDGGFLVPLSVIAMKYFEDCQREHQDPLLLSVLARLLHQQFPKAGKCRLGSRKNQKIHYSKLRLVADNPTQHSNSATAPLTPTVNVKTEKTPSEGSLSPPMQGDVKEPEPIVSGSRGEEKRPCTTIEVVAAASTQSQVKDIDESEKECSEAAVRLEQVVKRMCSQGKRELLSKSYAHSASCPNPSCSSLCLMFRRVRSHVVTARHMCKVIQIYTVLLKLHVKLCVDNDCGLAACPTMRLSRLNTPCLNGEQEGQQEKLRVMLSPDLMPNSPPSIHKNMSTPTITVEVDPSFQPEVFPKRIRV